MKNKEIKFYNQGGEVENIQDSDYGVVSHGNMTLEEFEEFKSSLYHKQEDSVGERLKLAEKLKELGTVNIDKRIYKRK